MILKDGDSRIVQFSHFSVKEYLTSNRLAECSRDVSRYHIQLDAAHTILAQACLGVLLRLDDDVDVESIENFPLARYAARYWVKHARFKDVSSRIEEGMDRLFDADKPHFANWLWIYNDNPSLSRPTKPDTVPLYHAALLGFRDLVERLLSKHPEHVNAKGGSWATPLWASSIGKHSDVFSILVDNFPDVNVGVGCGLTALHLASASSGHLEIGERLLSRGAFVNARSDAMLTPLWLAASWGRLELARMLIEHGALIDARSLQDETPLHEASRLGHIDVVRLLLENGADVGARNRGGMTPSDLASRRGLQGIVQLLFEYGQKSLKE
jgi:ankyrin repeat protein